MERLLEMGPPVLFMTSLSPDDGVCSTYQGVRFN